MVNPADLIDLERVGAFYPCVPVLNRCRTGVPFGASGPAGRHTSNRSPQKLAPGLLEIVWAIALKHTGGFTRFLAQRHRRLGSRGKLLHAFERAEEPARRHRLCSLGRHRRARRGDRRHRRAWRERLAAPAGFLALILVGIAGLKFVEGYAGRGRGRHASHPGGVMLPSLLDGEPALWRKRRTAQPKCSATYVLVLGNLRRRWDCAASRWSASPLG